MDLPTQELKEREFFGSNDQKLRKKDFINFKVEYDKVIKVFKLE